jgi:hypothetical protein
MRYIKILPDIGFTDVQGEPIKDDKGAQAFCPMFRFVVGRTTDPAFSENGQFAMADIVAGEEIRAAFRAGKDFVELSDDLWQRLKRATELGSYDVRVAGCLMPFANAIVSATTVKPKA